MQRNKRTLIALAFTAVLYLIMLTQPMFAAAIDNYGAAMLVGECFGSDPVFVHISAGYCKLLGWLSEILPHASTFMLAERFFILLGMFGLSDLILERVKKPIAAAALHLGLIGVYGLLHLYNQNYTVWTGFFVTVGWLLLASVQRSEEKQIARRILGLIMMAAGCVLRIQAVLMILPFMLLDMLLRCWDGKREGLGKRIQRTAALLIPAALIVAAAGAEIYTVYFKGNYSSEYAYNSARVSVVDYPMKDYSELENPTFSENDYECVRGWILMDTEIVTTEYLQEMREIGAKKTEFSWNTMVSRIRSMLSETRDHIPLFLLTLAMAVFLFVSNGWIQKLRAGLAVLGAGMILVYLCYKGRLPARVVYVILLGVLGNVFAAIVNDSLRGIKLMNVLAVIAAVAVFGCADRIVIRDAQGMQSAFDAKTVSEAAEDDDRVIIWDMMYCSSDSPLTDPFDENPSRLPDQIITDHNTSTGDVSSGQKSYADQLARMGIQNPMRALIERENTYLAATEKNAQRVATWLQEHYDSTARAVAVDTIGETTVWQYVTD